nr:PucR family transcriptional regulator [uncultured Actinoplanes sp.]
MLTGPLATLVGELAADEGLVDDVVKAAGAEGTATREQVAALLAAGFAAFRLVHEVQEADFSEAERFGAERAALGVGVAGLLAGVHAGRSRLLEIAITRGREAGIGYDALLQALLRLDRYGTALERHVMDGYRTAERQLNRDDRAARIRFLRGVLLGDAPVPDDLARFGMREDALYHCVVSDAAEPSRVRAMEQAFGRCGGVLAPVDGRLSGLAARLPAGRALDRSVLVVTTPPVPLGAARSAYRLCRTALRAAGAVTGVRKVADLAGETALAAQPMLAGFLTSDLLAALDRADEFHRRLASTALAYLDHGQRLDRTAAALHLHPNTVRYRLRRLAELTGFGDSGEHLPVLETVRWWWALHTWSSAQVTGSGTAGPPRPAADLSSWRG